MKKTLVRSLISICVIFTLLMIWCLVMGYIFVGPNYGLNLTASLLACSVGMALVQAFWFSLIVFKKLSYPPRILGFGLCGFPLTALPAVVGEWFPDDDPRSWAVFIVIYLVILALSSMAYWIYYDKMAGGYDKALRRYRDSHDRNRKP